MQTSGDSSRNYCIADSPVPAWPTTSSPSSRDRTAASPSRMMPWSSTRRIRIGGLVIGWSSVVWGAVNVCVGEANGIGLSGVGGHEAHFGTKRTW